MLNGFKVRRFICRGASVKCLNDSKFETDLIFETIMQQKPYIKSENFNSLYIRTLNTRLQKCIEF